MPGERFAQTRMRTMRAEEAQNWSPDDLQYAINEVFARHGRRFEDNKVAAVFGKLSWYRPRADLSNQQIEESLSEVEVENVMMLHSVVVARKEQAERARQAAIAQRQQQEAEQRYHQQVARAQQEAARVQQEAIRAQQEAEIRAQQEAAAAAIVGGLLNAIINRRR
jgi:hypothetical protein